MKKFELVIAGKIYVVYEGRFSFNEIRGEIHRNELSMLAFSGIVQALQDADAHGGRDSDMLFYLMSRNRAWADVGFLWCADKVYVWDHPERDASGNIRVCRNTSEVFLQGHEPDLNGITWYGDGRIRSLEHRFDIGHQSLEELSVNPLMIAIARRTGAEAIPIIYREERSQPCLSGYREEELGTSIVSALSFRGPSAQEGLSINPDSFPDSSDANSIALAAYKSKPSYARKKKPGRRITIPGESRKVHAVAGAC